MGAVEPDWMTLWRVIDGDVIEERAFEEGDSIIFESEQDVRYDYDDPKHVHVDDLCEEDGIFKDEETAKKYAVEWMNKKIFEYQLKLAKLLGTNSVI